MKRLFTIILVVLTISIFYEQTAFADQMFGSDISWRCIGKDSFLVKIVGYRDCNWLMMVSSPIYCYCNTTGSLISTVNTTVGSGTDITPTCKSSCTRCSNPSCSFPYGIQKYEFTTLVVLSIAGSCCEIRLKWDPASWSGEITTGAAAQFFYTEALLNRCQNPCASSPSFTNNPIIIACVSQPVIFQQGVIDTTTNNGKLSDSLTYQWTPPLQDYGKPTTWLGQYTYDNPLDYWGFPNQSLPYPRGFHLDPTIGDIQFQPMQVEITIMAVKVNQYRNGVLIGQITRNMGVIVINCTNHPPTITTPGNKSYIEGCADSAISFNFSTNDQDTQDSVTLSWNNELPGATFTTTNGLANHPTATLTWVPNDKEISFNPYLFTITAKDNACPINGSVTKYYNISVYSNQPKAGFTPNIYSQCVNGNNFIFHNSTYTCNGIFSSFWDFGDHTISTALSPSHTYSNTGTYTVKLIANTGLKDSSITNVYVYQRANFTTNKSSQCLVGNNFIFTNNSCMVNGILFSSLWDFGDHTTSTALSPTHSYTNAGTYNVKMIVISNSGFKDSFIYQVNVYPNPVTAFTISDTSECLTGNTFIFSNNSTGATSYLWEFGDKATSTNILPTHKYTKTGTYIVSLISTSPIGCKDSLTKNIYVSPQPVTAFNTSDTLECFRGNSFLFNNSSTGATAYIWDFGDNNTSTQTNPLHSFTQTGTYPIKLITINNYGCIDSLIMYIYIKPNPISAFAVNDSEQCLKGNYFIFTNNSSISSGTFTSLWNFGDTTSIVSSLTHTFKTKGIFEVKLIITSNYGCTDSLTKYVIVYPQPIVNIGKDTNIYDTQSLKLDAGGGFDSYLWSNNDTTRSIIVDSNFGKGKHLIWVWVTKDGCNCSDSINVTIKHFVSIDTKTNEFEVLVYPNPTNDVLNIEINGLSKDVFLNLTDLFGRQVKSLKVIGGTNHIYQTIDISGLGKGVYILNILGNDMKKEIKVIKY